MKDTRSFAVMLLTGIIWMATAFAYSGGAFGFGMISALAVGISGLFAPFLAMAVIDKL